MMDAEKKPSSLLGIVLVFLGLVVAALAGWKWYNRHHTNKASPSLSLEQLLERDKKNLDKENATPEEVYQALLRLAKEKDPHVKEEAFKRIKSPDGMIRAAAAEALGYYEGKDVLDAIAVVLKDPEKPARMGAVRGLGHRADPERIQMLKAHYQMPGLTEQEKIGILENLSRISSPQAKSEIIGHMVQIAQAGDNDENTEAALRAASLAPEDPRVVQMLKTKVRAGRNMRVIALAIRHLASLKDSDIRDRLAEFSKSDIPQIRGAGIQALHEACPSDRWKILNDALQAEENVDIERTIINEATILAGPQAKEFLNNALKSKKLNPELTALAKSSLAELETDQSGGSCKK